MNWSVDYSRNRYSLYGWGEGYFDVKLMAVLGLTSTSSLVICNGYKDRESIW
jgi:arginine decarboxylase-like protein